MFMVGGVMCGLLCRVAVGFSLSFFLCVRQRIFMVRLMFLLMAFLEIFVGIIE
jgi:hypothetical protein